MEVLKNLAAMLPNQLQSDLKRLHFRRAIRRGEFITDEPEYALLSKYVSPGDWVIDVGANVGHYTKRLSELVGNDGRVVALEPIPETFALLASNLQYLGYQNVTLINAAASNSNCVVGMSIPKFSSGLQNYYQAHISEHGGEGFKAMAIRLDSFPMDSKVTLIKIDAEGHESGVFDGMRTLIARFRPVLIIESNSKDFERRVIEAGYAAVRLEGSPNVLFHPA
jgi:FkbM family methyltransferase